MLDCHLISYIKYLLRKKLRFMLSTRQMGYIMQNFNKNYKKKNVDLINPFPSVQVESNLWSGSFILFSCSLWRFYLSPYLGLSPFLSLSFLATLSHHHHSIGRPWWSHFYPRQTQPQSKLLITFFHITTGCWWSQHKTTEDMETMENSYLNTKILPKCID